MKKISISLLTAALMTVVLGSTFAAPNMVTGPGTVNYLNPADLISSGNLVDLGDRYGVALTDIASNATGAVAVDGVFIFNIATNTTVSFGTALYFSNSNTLTTTAANGTYVGACTVANTGTAVFVQCYLNAPVNEDVGGATITNTFYTVAAGTANAITNRLIAIKGSVVTGSTGQ